MKTNFIQNFIQKTKKWYSNLPDKKKYFELMTAMLSVPMILTVIIVNLNSINRNKQTTTTAAVTTAPVQIIVESPATGSGNINPPSNDKQPKTTITPTPTLNLTPTSTTCKQGVGTVEISSPQEDEVITSDNVCISISTDSDYCGVSWAYKLDDGDWSNFTNQDICLYNLSVGEKSLQVKIKSDVVDKTVTLARNFIYKTTTTPTPTNTSTVTPTP